MPSKYFISANLKFLREAVGLTIEELASIVEVDPIDVFIYEGEHFEFDSNTPTRAQQFTHLAQIANYYTIFLDQLAYTDLRIEGVLDKNLFKLLKLENEEGVQYVRKDFNKVLSAVLNLKNLAEQIEEFNEDRSILTSSEEQVLRGFQSIGLLEDNYYSLRKRGLTEKNDFIEGSKD